MAWLFELLHGINAQRPGHSLFIAATQLPLEARVGGIFCGLLVAVWYFAATGRSRALYLPRGSLAWVLLSFIGVMGVDGLNAVSFDFGRFHLYTPSNSLRFATGLATGLALAAFALPSVNSVLWAEGEPEPAIADAGDLLGAIGLLGLVWVLVVADLWFLLYPIALLHAAGVVLSFDLANVYFLGILRRWCAKEWRGAGASLLIGAGVALLELLALAGLRQWLSLW